MWWSLGYACYRAYYAVGGQFGMIGHPVSDSRWRAINAVGAVVIALVAILALVAPRVDALRRALPALGWAGAVGCCMHALTDIVLRLLSLAGAHPTHLPASVWVSFDRRAADMQDLLLNEPWFFVEGLLWAALGAVFVNRRYRRAWWISGALACGGLTIVGVLSGLGTIGAVRLS